MVIPDSPTPRFPAIGRRQLLGAAAALVVTPALVAAAYASPSLQDATPDATPGTPVGTPASTPEAAPVAVSAAPVAISAIDLAFDPKDITIPAGTDIVFTVTNNGVLQHNWDVLGTAFKTAVVGGGAVESVTVNLPTGSYDFQCDVPGHAEAGMVGTLTVQ